MDNNYRLFTHDSSLPSRRKQTANKRQREVQLWPIRSPPGNRQAWPLYNLIFYTPALANANLHSDSANLHSICHLHKLLAPSFRHCQKRENQESSCHLKHSGFLRPYYWLHNINSELHIRGLWKHPIRRPLDRAYLLWHLAVHLDHLLRLLLEQIQ